MNVPTNYSGLIRAAIENKFRGKVNAAARHLMSKGILKGKNFNTNRAKLSGILSEPHKFSDALMESCAKSLEEANDSEVARALSTNGVTGNHTDRDLRPFLKILLEVIEGPLPMNIVNRMWVTLCAGGLEPTPTLLKELYTQLSVSI
ncbi:MAG: hypothetical protein RLY57_584 [Candidatus Parcubacteria bacterium]|jgi:hypothetical protein